MAQYARPSSDVNSLWTPSTGTTRCGCIDESSYDDGDYISTSTGIAPSPDQACALSSVTDPVSATGHILRYRAMISGGTTAVTVSLYQGSPASGGTLIASTAQALTGSFAPYTYTLSAAEANAITNYSALYVMFSRGDAKSKTQSVSFCEFEVPNAGATVREATAVGRVSAAATAAGAKTGVGRAFGQTTVSATAAGGKTAAVVAFGQVSVLGSSSTASLHSRAAFAQISIQATAFEGDPPVAVVTYAVGYQLDVGAVATPAPLLVDGSVADQATYYQDAHASANAELCAVYDLGVAGKVGRLRFAYGFLDRLTWAFDYSDDGDVWLSGLTLSPTAELGSCAFAWQSAKNVSTNLVTSAHRYWRLSLRDSSGVNCSGATDLRLGDFRIYSDADVEYVTYVKRYGSASARLSIEQPRSLRRSLADGLYPMFPNRDYPPGEVIASSDRLGTAMGAVSLLGSAVAGKIAPARATGRVSVSATIGAGRLAAAVAVGQASVSALARGTRIASAASAAQVAIVATPLAVRIASATGVGAVTIDATAVASKLTAAVIATGQVSVAAVVLGARVLPAMATGQVSVSALAVGMRAVPATATGRVSVSASVSAAKTALATAAGRVSIQGTSQTASMHGAGSTAVVSISACVEARKLGSATALASVSLVGACATASLHGAPALGVVRVVAACAAIRVASATAVARVSVSALATASQAKLASAVGKVSVAALAQGVRAVQARATAIVSVIGLSGSASLRVAVATGSVQVRAQVVGGQVGAVALRTADVGLEQPLQRRWGLATGLYPTFNRRMLPQPIRVKAASACADVRISASVRIGTTGARRRVFLIT